MPDTRAISSRTVLAVAFQCEGELAMDQRTGTPLRVPCSWGDLIALEWDMNDTAVLDWFGCPIHGAKLTKIRRISVGQFRREQGIK